MHLKLQFLDHNRTGEYFFSQVHHAKRELHNVFIKKLYRYVMFPNYGTCRWCTRKSRMRIYGGSMVMLNLRNCKSACCKKARQRRVDCHSKKMFFFWLILLSTYNKKIGWEIRLTVYFLFRSLFHCCDIWIWWLC